MTKARALAYPTIAHTGYSPASGTLYDNYLCNLVHTDI